MNLLSITAGAVGAVNPQVPLQVQVSTGSTPGADYTPQPTYAAPVTLLGQIQALQYKDLTQIEGLNLQGTRRAIYLYGNVSGIVRVSRKGGDLITDPTGAVWLTAMVLEDWGMDGSPDSPGWCKVVATLQDGA